MRRLGGSGLPSALLVIAGAACVEPRATQEAVRFEVPASSDIIWYKGNTHAHTTMSDGDLF